MLYHMSVHIQVVYRSWTQVTTFALAPTDMLSAFLTFSLDLFALTKPEVSKNF